MRMVSRMYKPWRGLERHVGSEQNLVESEELDAALGGRVRAEQRRIGIEHVEVIHRTLLHRFEQRHVVLIGGARAELIPAMADAAFKIRNHAAQVVRENPDSRVPVQQAGKDHPAMAALVS